MNLVLRLFTSSKFSLVIYRYFQRPFNNYLHFVVNVRFAATIFLSLKLC